MALTNKIDPQEAERNLTRWLATKLPGAEDVRVSGVKIPSASGLSAETVMFDASWRENGVERSEGLVARVQPSGPAVFPSYHLDVEYRVMKTLGEHTSVPVPRAFWQEDDPSVLGAPFLVMGRVDGRIPADDPPFTATGWVLELTADEQAALCENALQVLAALHAVDHRELGLDFLDRPQLGEQPLDQQIAYWERTFAWAAEGEPNPTIEAAFEWIRANRPTGEPVVLSWGDARIGNMLFAGDHSVAGVLDWEMVALGSPELDLAWWLFLLRHHTEGIGAPLPPGFPTAEATVARYQELTGHEVKHLHFYEAFSGLRLSILMVRAAHMMIEAGLMPPDAPMALCNPASNLLAKTLGLPAPTGRSVSFIGNR
jgi:aminoglycoside phosphotransferase (APT) family kinase protein